MNAARLILGCLSGWFSGAPLSAHFYSPLQAGSKVWEQDYGPVAAGGARLPVTRHTDFAGRYAVAESDSQGRVVTRAPAGQAAGGTPLTGYQTAAVYYTVSVLPQTDTAKLAEEARKAFGYFDGPGGLLPEIPNAIPGF